MRVLRRYLGREIYLSTALVFAALLVLFTLFDLIHELNDVGKSSYQLRHALLFVLLSIPGHIYELFPIAALLGTVLALSQLASHSELTVMRVSGISLLRLSLGVVHAGAVLALLTAVFGEMVAPASDRAAQRLRLFATSAVVAQEFRSGLWVKDEGNFINVSQVQLDSTLLGIKILEFDRSFNLRSVSFAEHGKYLGDNRWQLSNLQQTVFEQGGSRVVHDASREWRSVLDPDLLGVLLVKPEKMTVANLYSYVEHLRENRQRTTRYEIALWRKLIYPVAVLVMMVLALPFAQQERRAGGVSAKIFVAIMVGLSFHLLNRLFAHLGLLNEWPPMFSAVFPTVAFLLAALGMIWRVERR